VVSNDGGKKRKPFVDQTSLITFVSRLFGRIDALYSAFLVTEITAIRVASQ
jgi:hypothetical protein